MPTGRALKESESERELIVMLVTRAYVDARAAGEVEAERELETLLQTIGRPYTVLHAVEVSPQSFVFAEEEASPRPRAARAPAASGASARGEEP